MTSTLSRRLDKLARVWSRPCSVCLGYLPLLLDADDDDHLDTRCPECGQVRPVMDRRLWEMV